MTELASIDIIEGSDAVLLARVVGFDGSFPEQGDIDTITAHLFDLTSVTPATDLLNSTLTEATVFPTTDGTPVVDSSWVTDTVGFNFIFHIPGSNFSEGGRKFRIEIKIDADGGSPDYGQISFAGEINVLAALNE